MAFTAVTRRSVSDDVYAQIATHVVRGELAAGASLPSERRLAELMGVSRPAVREALQRLAQNGLVTVRQGGATTVNDFRTHAGLDMLGELLVGEGGLVLHVARSLLEARLAIGPIVARLAAERAGATLRDPLDAARQALADAPGPVERQRAALAFWDVIVDGADSIAFRLMYNQLRAAYEPALDQLAELLDAEVTRLDAYASLCAAIVRADSAAAESAATDVLKQSTTSLLSIIKSLESTS